MSELDRDELRQILDALADTRREQVAAGPELDAYLAGVDDFAAELIGRGHIVPPAARRTAATRPATILLPEADTGSGRRRRQDT